MERATWLKRIMVELDLHSSLKWFLLAGLIGVISGIGAFLFQYSSQAVLHYSLSRMSGYEPSEPAGEHSFVPKHEHEFSPLNLLLVLTAGGLISGVLVYTFAPEAEGHGTDAAIDAFHHKRGYIRPQVPLIKAITSAVTIGTGGSGGREGPIAQIGAGFGSYLATVLKLSARDRRIMLAAGMGAGVGAIFRAPLAGALFAAEILYSEADLETEVIVPAAVSSIVAYCTYSMFLPTAQQFMPLFGDGLKYSLTSVFELIPLSLLSIILVLGSALYINVFYGTHRLFRKLPVPRHFRPAIGAFLAGCVGLALFYAFGRDERVLAVLSTGYGSLQQALDNSGQIGLPLLLTIALMKIVTTSLTISSGGSGGVFGPSMVIGGCLGAAFGQLLHSISPALAPRPEIYTIMGMAGFFSGSAHAPISTIIMVSEMTGDYKLLLPTMWVSTICFLLCRPWKLYEKQLPSRLSSPAHRGDFIVDVLEGLHVGSVPLKDRMTIDESMTLESILNIIPNTRQNYFPVVDEANKLVGIFSTDDLRAYLYNEHLWKLAIARDIMTTRLVSVKPEDDLNTALMKFTELNLDEIPVISPTEPGKLLGMLRRKDTIAVYNRCIMERSKANQEELKSVG
jgi:CIC family chloride channel protein